MRCSGEDATIEARSKETQARRPRIMSQRMTPYVRVLKSRFRFITGQTLFGGEISIVTKNESDPRPSAWRTAGRPPMIAHRLVVEIGRLGPTFDFGAGHVVLDFNNTAAWPRGRPSNDRVKLPGTLILWAAEAKLISHSESIKLRRRLRTKYDSARRELIEADRFRGICTGY